AQRWRGRAGRKQSRPHNFPSPRARWPYRRGPTQAAVDRFASRRGLRPPEGDLEPVRVLRAATAHIEEDRSEGQWRARAPRGYLEDAATRPALAQDATTSLSAERVIAFAAACSEYKTALSHTSPRM